MASETSRVVPVAEGRDVVVKGSQLDFERSVQRSLADAHRRIDDTFGRLRAHGTARTRGRARIVADEGKTDSSAAGGNPPSA